MKKRENIYSAFEMVSALFMMLVLSWLTISFSLTYTVGQHLSSEEGRSKINIFHIAMDGAASDCGTPLNNPTEEKAPNGLNQLVEEYLHDNIHNESFLLVNTRHFKYEPVSNYVGFHGELLVPPPNIA